MKRSIGVLIVLGLCAIATLFFIQSVGAKQGNASEAKNAASAAFRDAAYQARLAAKLGEDPHVSSGRWSKDSDRHAYVAGYQQTYEEAREQRAGLQARPENSSGLPNRGSAAFRDGVYQARRAAKNDRKPHLSTGRWSKDSDRRAYVAGYQQAYLEARGQDGITVPEGIEQAGYRDGLEDGSLDRQTAQAPRLSERATVEGNTAYREAYMTGYQLAYYGEEQVQDALVIRPVVSR